MSKQKKEQANPSQDQQEKVKPSLDQLKSELKRENSKKEYKKVLRNTLIVVVVVAAVVVGPAVDAEHLIVGRHLFQGVGQVEGHLLFLRVEQDAEFVRLGNDVDHLFMLAFKIFVEALLRI